MNKDKIRHIFKEKRDNFSYSEKDLSDIFANALTLIKTILPNQYIGGYCPTAKELNILNFLETLEDNFHIALPYIAQQHEMEFKIWDKNFTKNNLFPFHQPAKSAKTICPNIVIAPMITCDKYGNRIGYGEGYYDRYLNKNPQIITIGLIHSTLIFPEKILAEKFDKKLNYISTEQGIINTDK